MAVVASDSSKDGLIVVKILLVSMLVLVLVLLLPRRLKLRPETLLEQSRKRITKKSRRAGTRNVVMWCREKENEEQ